MTSSQATAAWATAPAIAALPGQPFPLGATPGEHLGIAGTNFALASSVADGATLCLFDEAGTETQIPLLESDADIWYAFVPGIGPGQSYDAGLGAAHQMGWTGLIADVIRRRHGAVPTVFEVIRRIGTEATP